MAEQLSALDERAKVVADMNVERVVGNFNVRGRASVDNVKNGHDHQAPVWRRTPDAYAPLQPALDAD